MGREGAGGLGGWMRVRGQATRWVESLGPGMEEGQSWSSPKRKANESMKE